MHPSSGPGTHRLELRLDCFPKTESQKSLISRKLRAMPPGDCLAAWQGQDDTIVTEAELRFLLHRLIVGDLMSREKVSDLIT